MRRLALIVGLLLAGQPPHALAVELGTGLTYEGEEIAVEAVLPTSVQAQALAAEDCTGIQTDADGIASCASLAQSFIWQGNSSGLATALTNPSGRDIRTLDAACDGSTDDSTALQNCINASDGTDESTCLIPATGNACVINADVTPKSGASIVCTPGARLEMGSGVSTAMLNSGTAVNDFRITGCIFNADQVKKDVIRIATVSSGWSIDNNQFYWNYNGESASTNTTALDYVEIGCAQTSSTSEGCILADNRIYGSATDAQDDRGFNIIGGGGFIGLGTNFSIANNIVQGAGGNCIDFSVSTAAVVTDNAAYGCGEAGIAGSIAYSTVANNVAYVDGSGGTRALDLTVALNNRIVGNVFPTNAGGRGHARISDGSGTQFANNYAADGVHYVSSAPTTGSIQHAAIKNNVFSATNCADDPLDGGSLVACVYAENTDDLQVVSNTFVGTMPAAGGSAIRIVNRKTTPDDMAQQTRILNNVISIVGAAGTDNCIAFDDQTGGTDTGNGFANTLIVANTCGVEGGTAPDNCVLLSNVAEDANWADTTYSANIFDDCTNYTSGTRRAAEINRDTNVICASQINVGGATNDDQVIYITNQQAKVLGFSCHTSSSPGTPAAARIEDSAGDQIGSMTCGTGTGVSTWTDVSADADGTLVRGDHVQIEVTNTPSPTTDEYVFCIEVR